MRMRRPAVLLISLVDDDGGRFTIDANTGVVTVADAIDRETDGASRNITVRATSQDTSFTEETFTIQIVDADEFNVTARLINNATANSIDENMSYWNCCRNHRTSVRWRRDYQHRDLFALRRRWGTVRDRCEYGSRHYVAVDQPRNARASRSITVRSDID